MEAVPKLPLMSFNLKISPEGTHFGPKLKQYIVEGYREDPDSYSNEIHQLDGLRATAVRPTIDDAGLSALYRYFCQLRSIQSRFPMAKGQPAACNFVWKDLYANMNCTAADSGFELACILYNIGAMHTQLGAAEPRNTAESLKAACTHYQKAAWAFLHLREQYPQPSGVDISSEILRLLQEICAAQAQECILEKSIQDTKKPSVVGAVATQVQAFYKNALAVLGPSTGIDNIHEIIDTKRYNVWHRFLSFKLAYIGCIVCLHQGMNAEEQQKMGERVAFYQLAVERLNEARKLAKYIEPVQVTQEALTFTNDVVEGKRKAAKNENEFIYHEEVPEKDLLADLKPVCLVKALEINFNDPEISGPDLFSRLVPLGAHSAASVYSEEKAKLLRRVVAQVETHDTELMQFMSSLQLDQLDVLDEEQSIPQEIVDRCAAMNAKTEIIQTLVDSMNNLAEIISDVEHSLAEIKGTIQEEIAEEKEYQKVMGPRPPSIVHTELSREFHKYQEAHNRTNESNQVLHKAMTLHLANLRLLAQPLDVLNTKIPSIENIEGLDREAMGGMRRVVSAARHMQAQRDSLLLQLRDQLNQDDVTKLLLATPDQPAEAIFKKEIEKHTPQVKIIEQNLSAQENIINKLTTLYASYGESRRLLAEVLRKREGLINALITSYDSHTELLGKSQKGVEFYRKLSANVSQLLTRLRSTCQVQREERARHLHTQNKPSTIPPTSAGRPSSAAPAVASGLKLKDYLPYMKNRGRSGTPQAPPEIASSETYYPETIYPSTVRPNPVGSEATDVKQPNLPDGALMLNQNPYNQYQQHTHKTEPYAANNYNYPTTSKAEYEVPSDQYYSTPYTPSQNSSQAGNSRYSNPYFSSTQDNPTGVTDSQSSMPYGNSSNQYHYNVYGDIYGHNKMGPIPEGPPSYSSQDLSSNFANMQLSQPKPEKPEMPVQFGADYTQTYNNMHYPQASTPNVASYSHAGQPSNTSVMTSQISTNYPYQDASETSQYMQPNSMVPQYIPTSGYNQYDQNVPQYQPMDNNQNPAQNQVPMQHSQVPISQNQVPMSHNQVPMSHNQVPMSQNQVPMSQNQLPMSLNEVPMSQSQHPMSSNQMPHSMDQNAASTPQNPVSLPYNTEQYNYPPNMTGAYDNMPQAYPTYTNADSSMTYSTTNVSNVPVTLAGGYGITADLEKVDPNILSQLDAMDKPIKSHVTGEALSHGYQNYQAIPQNQHLINEQSQPQNVTYQNDQSQPQNVTYQNDQSQPQNVTYQNDQSQPQNVSYQNDQNFVQNHPGYAFNAMTGNYDYNYGSQMNTYASEVSNQGVYSHAGAYGTVQSPSETPNMAEIPQPESSEDQKQYYNYPYGYQTSQPNEMPQNNQFENTNYGAETNQSTYMQSGQIQDTSVTYTNNQVATQQEDTEPQPSFETSVPQIENIPNTSVPIEHIESDVQKPVIVETPEPPPTSFDLLSDIDFTVEYTPLKPEIKVPQISESAVKKPVVNKFEPVIKPVQKEEPIERPAKMDLFSDPSMLNRFTQEVKNLQQLVDSLTNKLPCGLTVLDSKWKTFQDVQAKENMTRTKKTAMKHSEERVVTDVAPYDDTRLLIKSQPTAYINASLYKQLAPWCIPIVLSKKPSDYEANLFWKGVMENKINCVACLLTEMELQGTTYWPTAKGQCLELAGGLKVTLDEVTCTVHWTERKISLSLGNTVASVSHYQINVFPAKIVCAPLVLLADKILSHTFDNRLSNQLNGVWVHCANGAGRSALLSLLLMVMCQVRAGQIDLCDMLQTSCITLYKHRTNVLEDTKYLADAYRTALFYVQGVLCSGTTMFNGEAVTVQSGASVLPQIPPTSMTSSAPANQKMQKFSRESFEEMKHSPGLKSGDMKDPLNFLDPLWSLKKK